MELAGWHARRLVAFAGKRDHSRSSDEPVVLTSTTTPEPLQLQLPTGGAEGISLAW